MITLYTFGPAFGLPDPSPFVIKAHLLLKLASLPYRTDRGGYFKAPKGKLPYIDDGGEIVADSTFIRLHIARKYGTDFERGLTPTRSGTIWALEKMCEDHLYWAAVSERWLKDENFEKVAVRFLGRVPPLVRPLAKALIQRRIRKDLRSQGLGRHTPAELGELSRRAVAASAAILGDAPWLGGAQPCGGDATLGAFMVAGYAPAFHSDLGRAIGAHANLTAYQDRVMRTFFAQEHT